MRNPMRAALWGLWVAMFGCLAGGCQPDDSVTIPPAPTPRRALTEAKAALLQGAETTAATAGVDAASAAKTRANSLEAMASAWPERSGPHLLQGLQDPQPIVRFAAAMGVGDTGYGPARSRLRAMLADDPDDPAAEPDRRVLPALVYALYQLGDRSYAHLLGPLLDDREPEVVSNTALVLSKMAEPSAAGPLKTVLDEWRRQDVRLQLIEALAVLGDEYWIGILEAYTKTPFIDDRLMAIQGLGRVQHPRAAQALQALLGDNQPPRVRVASAGSLAYLRLVTDDTYRLALAAAGDARKALKWIDPKRRVTDQEVQSMQQLASRALGAMGRPDAVGALYPLLKSPAGTVRAAAGEAILKLLVNWDTPIGAEPRMGVTSSGAPREEPGRAGEPSGRDGAADAVAAPEAQMGTETAGASDAATEPDPASDAMAEPTESVDELGDDPDEKPDQPSDGADGAGDVGSGDESGAGDGSDADGAPALQPGLHTSGAKD